MSNLNLPYARSICAVLLGVALVLCATSGIALGAGWRIVLTTTLCTTATVHAVSLPDDRQSGILRHLRMFHVAVVVISMNAMIPSGPLQSIDLLPFFAMLPIIAMATIRQMVGRDAAIVPIRA